MQSIPFQEFERAYAITGDTDTSAYEDSGFSLNALKDYDLLNPTDAVGKCSGCVLYPDSSAKSVAELLAGSCDAILFGTYCLSIDYSKDPIVVKDRTVNDKLGLDLEEIMKTFQPRTKFFTIVMPVVIKSSTGRHLNLIVFKVSTVSGYISYSTYEPHGYLTSHFDIVRKEVICFVERLEQLKSFKRAFGEEYFVGSFSFLESPKYGAQCADRDVLGLPMEPKVPEGGVGFVNDGMCSSFGYIMMFLTCLFNEKKTMYDIEMDLINTMVKAVKTPAAEGQKKDRAMTGLTNLARVFSLNMVSLEDKKNRTKRVCCNTTDGYYDHLGIYYNTKIVDLTH